MKVTSPESNEMRWWGKGGLAHHVAVLSSMRTTCGRTLAHRGHDFTRLDTETGKPWPRCKDCERKLAGVRQASVEPKEEP